ncbi:INO80 complex subunit B-like [Mercenaria mercenaria]|uniref:INO80 complex subunit B-like n=1 Tax=Mercenaria mercenaria TaxID=6596 RepID=UPI00234F771D|nr:INO80 complex subunit B-like [Mercenaria mercenaria]
MGKRRESMKEKTDRDESPESISSPPHHKKHKKHKKKHKRKGNEEPDVSSDIGSPKGPLKLKLKIGTETLGTKNVVTVTSEPADTIVNVTDDQWEVDERDPTIRTKKPGDETSDEEKEWLSALEKGELDDYGEVSKGKKDPSLMTARQRALKHGTQEQELLQLPTGYRQVELTEEQLKRREQRANKRKQMAQEKREKDKRQTIDRLLKKQESRLKKGRGGRKTDAPKVTYINNTSGISISVPEGIQFPFEAQKSEKPPPRPKCAVKSCKNDKKYSCSKTGVPLCSLECYKKNLISHKLTPPSLITT